MIGNKMGTFMNDTQRRKNPLNICMNWNGISLISFFIKIVFIVRFKSAFTPIKK